MFHVGIHYTMTTIFLLSFYRQHTPPLNVHTQEVRVSDVRYTHCFLYPLHGQLTRSEVGIQMVVVCRCVGATQLVVKLQFHDFPFVR